MINNNTVTTGEYMKKCFKCKQLKNESEFHKNKTTKDGLNRQCKKCVCEERKKFRILNPYKVYTSIKKSISKNPIPRWVSNTLGDHKRRGYTIEITNEELKYIIYNTNNKCELCDTQFCWDGGLKYCPNRPTLDRVDNSDKITKNNVMIICHKCNFSKGDRSLIDFISYCNMISLKFENTIVVNKNEMKK